MLSDSSGKCRRRCIWKRPCWIICIKNKQTQIPIQQCFISSVFALPRQLFYLSLLQVMPSRNDRRLSKCAFRMWSAKNNMPPLQNKQTALFRSKVGKALRDNRTESKNRLKSSKQKRVFRGSACTAWWHSVLRSNLLWPRPYDTRPNRTDCTDHTKHTNRTNHTDIIIWYYSAGVFRYCN